MATPGTNSIRNVLRRIVEDHRVRELSDRELLQRFVAQQDESVFHALVRRHGAMVFEVCRGILRTEADAEDAFQVTFLVLARKAASIRKVASLAAWLHGVAYRTALKVRRQAATRQNCENNAPERQPSEPNDLTWREVRQVLHEEVNDLAEHYRAPLILCYLEGRSQDEAAAQLGLPKGTLKGRLERARKLLHSRLLRRGLGPTALLAFAAWPASTAAGSVPPALTASAVHAACMTAAGHASAGLVSAHVAELTTGILKGMAISKLKLIATVLVALTVTAVGVLSAPLIGQALASQSVEAQDVQTQKPNGKVENAKVPAPRASEPDWRSNLLIYKDGERVLPVRTASDWEKRRKQILANMELVMGKLPDAASKVPADLRIENEEDLGKILRKKISIGVAKDERVAGYLLMPKDLKGKVPGILCPHQTNGPLGSKEPAGVSGLDNQATAKQLAERGYVCLTIDYPGYGGYKPFNLPKTSFQSGVMKGIWNNMCAIDALQALPEVDANKIGCVGHSLGGHVTMFIAAFDPRIKVIVSNCGFTSFPKYSNGNLKNWSTDLMMPRIATEYDSSAAKVPFDFPEVVATFAPRPFLAVSPTKDDFSVAGVKDCITSAEKVYGLFEASDRLAGYHPEYGHHFAAGGRKKAYEFLDRFLK